MEKVIYKELRSANVAMDNSVDTERVYDIEANISIGNGNKVNGVDAGNVKKEGVHVANFNIYGIMDGAHGSVNITCHKQSVSEQCAILNAVDAFITDVEEKVKTEPFSASV